MKMNFRNVLVLFLGFATMVSCVEEQDFGQYDDLRATPTVEASILYIEVPEFFINAAGDDTDIISRNFNFEAFSSDIFAERVLDGTVTYIVENTTSKPVDVFVELLDVEGNVLDVVPIESTPGMELQTDIAYGNSGRSINIIKNTSSIQVTARNKGDSTSTSDLPDPKIILKSSGKFRLNIK